jgi:hypothetical protein
MDINLYTSDITNRFKNLIYNDTKVLNVDYFIYRMGGCSTILKLAVLDNEWKHCTSADLFGAVTSDCCCEYLNTTNNKQELLNYINTAINGNLTNTSLDMILNTSETIRSVSLILSYYKQHIQNYYAD